VINAAPSGGKVADKIRIGRIKARNVVSGGHGNITDRSEVFVVRAEQSRLQAEALQQLREFIQSLPAHAHEIDAESAQKAAKSIETALSKRRIRRDKIEKGFNAVLAAIGGITTLANAIAAVQATVGRLIG
jgi:1-deoxy-D-xylulose 5-phosphate reductoisomerase